MTHPLDELEDQVIELEQMLEQSNAEKQQWKQCANTLADALESIYLDNLTDDPYKMRKMKKAVEQFKKLRDQ